LQPTTRLTLLMPTLLANMKMNNAAQNATENLALFLSKAEKRSLVQSSGTLALFANLSHHVTEQRFPKAALSLFAVDEPAEFWVCYASPVIMQPNRDHLAITQCDGFDFDEQETAALTDEFNDYFQDDGLTFTFKESGIWFCHSSTPHETRDDAPRQIMGRNVIDCLPEGRADISWRKIFNETQMLLHHSATNRDRVTKEKPEINSLWFWGGGCLSPPFQLSYQQVFTHNVEMIGLVKLGNSVVSPLPTQLSGDLFSLGGEYCIYLDSHEPVLLDGYLDACLSLLKNKSLDEVCIIPNDTQQFVISRQSLKKFWRLKKDIAHFIDL